MRIGEPVVVAHRGLHHEHAENTLGAFMAAVDSGIPWVECDVWPSADGIPMVIHDESVDRTTSATGAVSQFAWEHLQKLGVPSLSDVLSVLPDRTGILVEIKPVVRNRKIVDLLEERRGPWMIQSFLPENISHAVLQTSGIPTALLVEDALKLAEAVGQLWHRIYAEHSLITKEIAETLHTAGRRIGAWTVNDPADIQRMIDLNIDMLITDEPILAMEMIATQSP